MYVESDANIDRGHADESKGKENHKRFYVSKSKKEKELHHYITERKMSMNMSDK